METLKLVLFLTILGLLGTSGTLFLWGGGDGTFRDEGSVKIAGPPELVFQWLCEPERRVLWVENLERCDPESGGSLRVGSRLRETLRIDDRLVDREVGITEIEYGRRLTMTALYDGVPVTIRYSVKAHNSGRQSRVRFEVEAQYTDWFGKLAEPVLGGMLFDTVLKDLERLGTLDLYS